MAWAVPRTWVAGEMVSAALLNQDIRDNLGALVGTRAAVATSQTTTSTTYTDLATTGPAITVTTLKTAWVYQGSWLQNNTSNVASLAAYAVSGVTTIAAADDWALAYRALGANFHLSTSRMHRTSALTPGSNTFTMKYRVTANTGTFSNREIIVVPVGLS